MTFGKFLTEIGRYKNGRHRSLFSVIDMDLRNCFDHANIGFNSEITCHDRNCNQKRLKLDPDDLNVQEDSTIICNTLCL